MMPRERLTCKKKFKGGPGLAGTDRTVRLANHGLRPEQVIKITCEVHSTTGRMEPA